MIRLQCSCGKEFRIPEEFMGKQGRCPDCSTIIIVPYNIEDIPSFSQLPQRQQTFNTQELFEHVIDSVVGISFEDQIYGSGVLIDANGVVVSERPIDGLDPQELEGTIGYLSGVADDIDDRLAAEFKARMYLEGEGSRF
jgi:hypothetical protein